ncbi:MULTISPECIES: hypothetical protein [unclassified Corynebacterium]|uniref:hypothetical protein n=1 Tax=unclassified Corynebacterium TaxID=2624378 RepID=UPI0029C9EA55|nr:MULTISPECIES: hypothetical protein [unclassified Corynebacterium]WPF65294.1 hypothetical protein OLX12_06815 [Corynebacterium sp. 22KM0430]WPF67789.1 hypothetical protein OLW90_06805 [Corynebacterium sp. 21KM1197]
MSKSLRRGVAAAAASVLALGSTAVASAVSEPHPGYEEHLFSGSSTSVAAFENWFAGGEFVQPEYETRDLRSLKVNEHETAEAGDTVYKDDQGRFWVKQDAVVK